MNVRSLLAAALLALALPGAADAETAYVAGGTTNMREGPGRDYPVIARVRGGSRVEVLGCLEGYSWCDVIVEDMRGWVSATRLEFSHAGQLVPLWSFHTFFNAPTIGNGARYGRGGQSGDDGRTTPDCADPNVLCPDEGPVECESCPWPSGRAPGLTEVE